MTVALDFELILIVCGAMLSTLVLTILVFGGNKETKIRKQRLTKLTQMRHGQQFSFSAANAESVESLRKQEKDRSRLLSILSRIAPKRVEIERLLAQTGKDISIGQFVGTVLIVSFSLGVLIHWLTGLNWVFSFLFGIGGGVFIPLLVVKNIAARRLSIFLRDFPDAIDLMVRGLRSGLPVSESITSVSREFEGPIGIEFTRVIERVQFGKEMEKALWEMVERLPSADVKFFVITLSIQKDTGGNLADTLMNLSMILRSRKQMVLKVKALSSEARASAMILGSLPFVLFAILSVISPDYIFMLFEDPRGHKMLMVGGGLILTGIAVMRKLVNFRI